MIHPAIIAFWVYGTMALLIGVWAAARLDLVAGLLPFFLWLLGIAEQLLSANTGGQFTAPVWLYLAMDAAACLWFWRRLPLFALTFAPQMGLEAWQLVVGMDAWSFWWGHWGTAMVQLGVLAALARRRSQ